LKFWNFEIGKFAFRGESSYAKAISQFPNFTFPNTIKRGGAKKHKNDQLRLTNKKIKINKGNPGSGSFQMKYEPQRHKDTK
jgi:hypothetical protein